MAINPTVSRGSATTQIAPPVVAAVVVHEPGAWFAETLQALAQQDYPNLQTLFFVTSGSQTAEEIASAERIVAAFRAAEARGEAAVQVDGLMVDYPIVYQAERLLKAVKNEA